MPTTATPDPAIELAMLICDAVKGRTDHAALLTLADRFLSEVDETMPADILDASRKLGMAAFEHAFYGTQNTLAELEISVRVFSMLNFLRPKP